MTTPLEKLLAKSRELREKATTAPWIKVLDIPPPCPVWAVAYEEMGTLVNAMESEENCEFAAHARNCDETKDAIIETLTEALEYIFSGHPDNHPVDVARDAISKANELASKVVEE